MYSAIEKNFHKFAHSFAEFVELTNGMGNENQMKEVRWFNEFVEIVEFVKCAQ